MKIKIIAIFSLFTFLSGCVSTPKVLQGEFDSISPAQSKTNHTMNKKVRWSGLIVQTVNKADKTCFEIVESETYQDLRPKRIIPKNGSRFIACKEGFLEPTAFNKRMVTITGNLVAYTESKIGEYDYEYPVVQTDVIYIWRKGHYQNINVAYYPFSRFSCGYSYLTGYCY